MARITALTVTVFTINAASYLATLNDATIDMTAEDEQLGGAGSAAAAKQYVNGRRSWTLTADVDVDTSAVLADLALAGTAVAIAATTYSGGTAYTGTAVPKGVQHRIQGPGKQTISVTMEGVGALSVSA